MDACQDACQDLEIQICEVNHPLGCFWTVVETGDLEHVGTHIDGRWIPNLESRCLDEIPAVIDMMSS